MRVRMLPMLGMLVMLVTLAAALLLYRRMLVLGVMVDRMVRRMMGWMVRRAARERRVVGRVVVVVACHARAGAPRPTQCLAAEKP
jgi:hypothetical protein